MFGEELIWLFILGDMATFSMFFWIYGYARTEEAEIFRASQDVLSVHYGSINTLVLLTSSWFVMLAARSVRHALFAKARRQIAGGMVFGFVFAVLKMLEYNEKIAAGYTFGSNNFFMFYYLLTGLHYAHLLTGLGLLAYFAWVFGQHQVTNEQVQTFGSGAIFWHMVDLLWIIIFTLLYLLP